MTTTSPGLLQDPTVAELFRARYLDMVRLAGLLGADDPEDIPQDAFVRLMKRDWPPLARTRSRTCAPSSAT